MPQSVNTVGIIDIGSNSIKLLVASKGDGGRLVTVLQTTDETRIGDGITSDEPRLHPAGMDAACHAVKHLVEAAREAGALSLSMTATSAVRDATNRDSFAERLLSETGLKLEILTGAQEGELIACGLRCDPNLNSLTDFYAFDLGGGSLEAITVREGTIGQVKSLPLGCVRLTEKFVPEPRLALGVDERRRIEEHTSETLRQSGFSFNLPEGAATILTGGTAAVARLVCEAKGSSASGTKLSRDDIEYLLDFIGALPLPERRRVPGLPPERADVFPTALATLLAVLKVGNLVACRHSFYNLRYGLAARLLLSKDWPH